MGRKPLPREIKQLRGTIQPCRDRPSSTVGDPVKLEEVAQKCQESGLQSATVRARKIYWDTVRKVAAQGMLDPAFCSQLFFYAVEYDFFMSCCESVRKDGAIIVMKDKKGNMIKKNDGGIIAFPNPAVKNREKALEKLIKIGSNFGFDPVSRSRLKAASLLEDPKKAGIKAVFAAVFADNEDDGAEEQ